MAAIFCQSSYIFKFTMKWFCSSLLCYNSFHTKTGTGYKSNNTGFQWEGTILVLCSFKELFKVSIRGGSAGIPYLVMP